MARRYADSGEGVTPQMIVLARALMDDAAQGRRRVPARLQDGAGGNCLEAAGIALPGRSPDWLKFKNPEAPAVKGVAEKDWR